MFALCIEASHQKGMGHLFRMLNFADTLVDREIPFMFLVNQDDASESLLSRRNLRFETVPLSSEADWQSNLIRKHGFRLWIDDRLDTGLGHSETIRGSGIPRVTFDDRGPGAALADLNVAGLALDDAERLEGRRILRGPRYLVLNRDIARYRRLRTKEGSILLTMGGADTYGVTPNVVRMLKSAGRHATVIVGPAFRHEAELRKVLNGDFVLKRGVPSLMEEFSHHALAITAGGITPFEANASGLPCIVIATETFEIPVGQGIARFGGALFAGHYQDIDQSVFSASLPIGGMSEAAMRSFDLDGAARVTDQIEAML